MNACLLALSEDMDNEVGITCLLAYVIAQATCEDSNRKEKLDAGK